MCPGAHRGIVFGEIEHSVRSAVPDMTSFVAACRAVGMTSEDACAVHTALLATSARMAAGGEGVRYLRSSYLPDMQWWFGIFAAEDPHVVRRITKIAQLPSVEVCRAVEFRAQVGEGDLTAVGERSRSR